MVSQAKTGKSGASSQAAHLAFSGRLVVAGFKRVPGLRMPLTLAGTGPAPTTQRNHEFPLTSPSFLLKLITFLSCLHLYILSPVCIKQEFLHV